MSKAICTDAIAGARETVARAKATLAEAIAAKGRECAVAFPGTAYYLPVIYSFTGRKVTKLGDMDDVLADCDKLLPEPPSKDVWLPYLGDTLDAGAATLFAFECIEACKTVIGPNPVEGIWLGAANDTIMRERGIEFVDGTAPGFAAIVGAAPNAEIAVKIARELQEKNLYVFMAGSVDGVTFSEQLHSKGVQLGWETRLVPFGRDVSAAIYALGFANRAALSFGGVAPGDFAKNLKYNKNRIFAFVLALGEVDDEKYAAAAGAINYGFPTIADTDIPQILPTGVCTYEHVVSNVPHDKIVERALEVRGCKVKVTKVPIPVPYGAAFEGERIRKNEVRCEFGGNRTTAFEFVQMAEMDQITDGKIEIIGPEIDQVPEGSALPLAIWVQVAGRKMQPDFEPILERQIHHLLNGAEGLWHMGQRDIVWTRVSKNGFAKGLRLKHYGEIIHAKFLADYPAIVDKVQVTLITDKDEVERRVVHARKVYVDRNKRLESMTDEAVDTFYSCLLCQSFAPNHVCIITPERLGLCGAYNWLDGKAAYEIDETGPNRPVVKGRCLDPVRGIWEGVNEVVYANSHKTVSSFTAYSLMDRPMTSCGCFEAIIAYVPECNGVMIVNREFMGDTPSGMPFSTLAGSVGGGVQTPGFMGVGKAFLTSRKLLYADGGLKRIVWMTKALKNTVGEDFKKRAAEEGIPNFLDLIADEEIATAPDEIAAFMKKVNHPALSMPDMSALWSPEAATAKPAEHTSAVLPKKDGETGRRRDGGKLPDTETQKREDAGKQHEAGGGMHEAGTAAREPAAPVALSATDQSQLLAQLKAELKEAVLREVVGEIIGTLQDKFLGGRVAPASVPAGSHTVAPPTIVRSAVSGPKAPAAPCTASHVPKDPDAETGASARPVLILPAEPKAFADEKLAAVKSFEIPREKPTETIVGVTLGATKAEGGTRGRTIMIGGQNCMPFHYFEGSIPHAPVFALEVFDTVSPKTPVPLREFWGRLLEKPAEMAKACVEKFGAEMISVRLEGTHPEKGAKSPEAALALVKEILAAVDVPLIVTAHNHFETANGVLKAVAAGCKGERLLLNWVEGDNYRTIAGAALGYGHCVVARSPIDVNLSKQLNILLTNMELPRDRIVNDPLTGALGYGIEYTYSVVERIRLTGLGGDKALSFPMICAVGQEAWKVKEASAPESAFPAWGNVAERGIMWEIQTAMPVVLAGADLLIMYHPEALAAVRRNVQKLSKHSK
ncbi:MAG TPA: acetyl-CoA decarbonylase/synthase complex subunit alpha/beta [Planctomycetota bacterium]|jgi:acetyl-CoA synthase